MAIIGIDLGTTNSLACVFTEDGGRLIPNSLGNLLTPSAVSLDQDGNVCVGEVAKERLITDPECSAASFKRYMGTDRVFVLGGRQFTPQELSSFVLRQLKEDAERYLGQEVTEAVVSVPAYFNDNQRYATKEAGKLAGIKVERLINEPSAAALAASRLSGKEEQSYLIFDFGGGTLDVSVVDYYDNIIEIIAVSGDNRLGGDDFDEAIARRFCLQGGMDYEGLSRRQSAMLLRQAELCKRELTCNKEAVLRFQVRDEEQELRLDNIGLAQLCSGIFDRILRAVDRALKDSERSIEDVDEVVLVGGSSKMPVVSFFLETYYGKKPCIIGSPDAVVAMGAGIYAGIKERRQEIKDLVLTDICPFTLGVDVVNYQNQENPIMSPVIERNSILPTSKTGYYANAFDFQRLIEVGIYQGEAYYCKDNIKLGAIEMELSPVKKGEAQFEVCFTYDINGILEVEVINHQTGERKNAVLTDSQCRLTAEELEDRLKELMAYKIAPPGNARARLALARGERLFAELLGEQRRLAAKVLEQLQKAIYSQNDQQIANAVKEAERAFDRLEGMDR